MWATKFYVSTMSDNLTKEEIARYIRNRKKKFKGISRSNQLRLF